MQLYWRKRISLSSIKKTINNLTKRKISYIIVTGGLSELAGFGYLVEEMFGAMAKVCNITTMGIRHNKYVSVLGIVKYLDDKLSLRGKQMNMIDGDELDDLVSDVLLILDDTQCNSDLNNEIFVNSNGEFDFNNISCH